jgi:hypothetical protein
MRRLLIVLLMSLMFIGCASKNAAPTVPTGRLDWPAGTVLVSRNKIESENKSPGYWNHLYLYIGDSEGVESQEGQGVIKTSLKTYLSRDYEWFPVFPEDEAIGRIAAAEAPNLLGLPYSAFSSMLRVDRNEEKGLNCVSVVRVCYSKALGHSLPKLKKPDDILEMTDVFTKQGGLKIYPVVAPRKAA